MDKIVFDPPKTLQIESTSPEGFRTRVTVRAAKVPDEVPAPPDDTEIEEDELPRYVQVDVDWEDGRGVEDLHAEDPAPCVSTRRSWGRKRRMTTRRPSRAAGFTLLEVVLAMTSLAMLTAIIYGAFHLGTRALEKGQNAVVTSQRLRATNDVLIRQIKSAVAYPARNEDEGAYLVLQGDAQHDAVRHGGRAAGRRRAGRGHLQRSRTVHAAGAARRACSSPRTRTSRPIRSARVGWIAPVRAAPCSSTASAT